MSSLTDKERLGFVMENFVKAQLTSLGFEHFKHTGKESYRHVDNQTRRGVDFNILGDHGELLTVIECKNWKTLKRKYSIDIAQTEVIDRFQNLDAKFKVLVISNFDVFDKQAQDRILSSGIHVFETEKLIGSKIFRSREFFVLKARLDQFFDQIETQLEQRQQREQQLIDQYLDQQRAAAVRFVRCSSYSNSLLSTTNLPKTTKTTYDTPLQTLTRELIETIENTELPVEEIEQLGEKVNINFA